MALPSQTGRALTPRARVTGRRRRGGGWGLWIWGLLVLAPLSIAGWYGYQWWTSAPAASAPQREAARPEAPAPRPQPRAGSPRLVESQPTTPARSPVDVIAPTPLPREAAPPPPAPPVEPTVVVVPQEEIKPVPAPEPKPEPKPAPKSEPVVRPAPLAVAPPPPTPSAKEVEPDEPLPAAPQDASVVRVMDGARTAIAEKQYLQARSSLARLLADNDGKVDARWDAELRQMLIELSAKTLMERTAIAGDPLVDVYVVQQGDYLVSIAPKYKITYQLLERINRVKATQLWVGRKLKVLRGPFHARVDKSDYRIDFFLRDADGGMVVVASFPVGLGERDSTPVGVWRVRPGSKVRNPAWPDPVTGKYYAPDDPENPIGEYWIGLEGMDDHTSTKAGYGIHGTIDPRSIGQQMSLGCIRMRDADLERAFEFLVEADSTVTVAP